MPDDKQASIGYGTRATPTRSMFPPTGMCVSNGGAPRKDDIRMNDSLRAAAQTTTTTRVRLKLFGSPQLAVEHQLVSLPRRQLRALLYRLAVSLQPVAREHLCFLLWSDAPEMTARRYLTVLLNRLREALPVPELLLAQRDAILLDPTLVDVDTMRLAGAMRAAPTEGGLTSLRQAVDLYEGPFLHGFTLPASPEFDAWTDQERRTWERRYLDALALLVDGYASQGAYPLAIEMAQRALAVDELAEDMHRRLIELYAAAGERTAALRQFERCVVVLERELGVRPLAETQAVYEDVRDGRLLAHKPATSLGIISGAKAITNTAASPPTRMRKLPAAPTPLLGRAEELAQASAMVINPSVRLLTLCGAGGSGKTRLAQHIAWDVADLFADGVVFVPLASLRDPALVIQAIASVCELKQASAIALADYLHTRHMLLILDNCEHLLEAGPDIAALLAAAPQLHILATSRTALHVQGEHSLLVPPLPLPDLAHLPPLNVLSTIPSVALLLARTQALNPRFQLTPANAANLAAICVRLDGLPLAIELAAARLKLLTPLDMLRRLDRRLAALTIGPRDLPDRQRTLRATIDWSYRLLDTDEQYLFERVAVFAGSWSLEAAEAVCAAQGTKYTFISNVNVLDGLAVLVDKSLVQYAIAEDGAIRFSMLETIREYAAEQLVQRGAWEALSQAHAGYYVTILKHCDWNALEWIGHLARDHDNLRAMLRWYLDHTDGVEQLLEISQILGRFWYWSNHHTEGRWWFKRILAQSEGIRTTARAEALQQAASLAAVQGDNAGAITLFEANLQLCLELGLMRQRARALSGLGIVRCRQGDFAAAVVALEEAVVLARQLSDPELLSAKLIDLGSVLVDQGRDIARAIALYEEGLAIARAQRLPVVESMGLTSLGIALTMSGSYTRAAEVLGEALRLQRELRATMAAAWTHQYLGMLAYLQEDYVNARQYFGESLAATSQGGGVDVVPSSLDGLAGVASAQHQPVRAARLLGAAEALRQEIDCVLPPIEQPHYNRIRMSVCVQLSEDTMKTAWQAGHRLTLKQAIVEATAFARGEAQHDIRLEL
jgi:predicted ATPase/DNA-binding SARP family transcriptional activator